MGQGEGDMRGDQTIGLAAVQNPNAEQLPDEQQAAKRVLIVDHDKNVLIALKRLLGETRYDVTTAQDGLKALQLLWQGTWRRFISPWK